MTIHETLRKTDSRYRLSPIDAGILLSLAAGKPKEFILAHPEKKLTPAQERKYRSFARRRSAGEPIAYITGKKEFFGLEFFVNKNVLIPRPETELIVESVVKKIQNTKYLPAMLPAQGGMQASRIPNALIDVGTGSGNIVISIAKNLPEKIRNEMKFYAVDISKDALRVASANARKHKIGKKIKFVQSDLLEYFLSNGKINAKNLFVTANLPYVSPDIYQKNKRSLKFEPRKSLVSGRAGLYHYIKLIGEIRKIVEKNCILHISCFMEISPEQKPLISPIFGQYFPKAKIRFFKDLSGRWRVMSVET